MHDVITRATVRRGAPIRGWRPAVALVVSLLAGPAQAQPYVAAGGFGRPWLVAGPGVVAAVGVAADENRAVVVWADHEGVWLREMAPPSNDRPAPSAGSEPAALNLSGPGSIRNVTVAMAGGEPAVAWQERDLRTGRTAHMLSWRDHEYLLFEAGQEIELQVGSGAGRPWVLAAQRFDGRAHLQLFTVDEAFALQEPITLYSTTQAVRGATAMSPSAPGTAFPRWIGWLEGETSSGAFGVDAEWSAYAMLIANGGVGGSEPLELGRADVHDERQLVVLGPPAAPATTGTATAGSTTADTTTAGTTTAGTPTAGTPTAGSAAVTGARALWLGVDGTLQLTTLQAADETADETAEVGETVDLGESGRPLAVLAEHVYWHVDEFVRRTVPSATGTARTNAGEPISVAWSPVIIADAELAATGDVGDETRTTIAWYGRTQGGAVEVYASDDSRAFTPNLADRVGAVMGWSPWALWQEAAGQLLTSLLVGVVAAIALSPLLFAFSFLVASVKGVRERPALGGVALGALTPLAVASFIALRFPQSGVAQLSQRGLVVAFSALALGAVVAYLVNYRADREAQLGVLFAAFSVVLVAVSGWAFVEYDVWAPVMGLG